MLAEPRIGHCPMHAICTLPGSRLRVPALLQISMSWATCSNGLRLHEQREVTLAAREGLEYKVKIGAPAEGTPLPLKKGTGWSRTLQLELFLNKPQKHT